MSRHLFPLTTGEIYHVYNRGSEKKTIFLDDDDHGYMLQNLFLCNDDNKKMASTRRFDVRCYPPQDYKPDKLVEILAFALLPNHYHLLLRQIKDAGIAKFMQKLGTSEAMYFNKKYGKTGHLFQGTFKSRYINNKDYLFDVVGYIHANPMDLVRADEESIITTLEKLKEYQWGSLYDYLSVDYPSRIISPGFILEIMDGPEGIKANTARAIEHRNQKTEAFKKVQDIEILKSKAKVKP